MFGLALLVPLFCPIRAVLVQIDLDVEHKLADFRSCAFGVVDLADHQVSMVAVGFWLYSESSQDSVDGRTWLCSVKLPALKWDWLRAVSCGSVLSLLFVGACFWLVP